jgi:flagellar hook-associated protein 2
MTISSLGVGSGLQAEQIISSLLSLERKPLDALETQEKGIKTKVSSFGQLQSLFSDLQNAARELASPLLWSRATGTSSNPAAVTVSAGNGSPLGAFSVNVTKLAVAQTATSTPFASSATPVGEGTLTIQLGTWSGDPVSGFAAKSGAAAVPITIGPGETSLAQIRDKINAAGAGVTASIVNDASGARLSLISTATGAENGFRITADGGLSSLAYDPLGAGAQLQLNQAASNAKATINNIEIESASNTLSNVVEGLTVNLLAETTAPVTVTTASDTTAVKAAIETFVKAFNALASTLKTQTKYDEGSKTAGPLQGDRTAIGLQNRLRGILNEESTASTLYTRLSDIGLVMKTDGTLETKSSKLDEALSSPANLAELRKLFATEGTDDAGSGFMVRYRQLAATVLGAEGVLTTVTESLNGRIRALQKREDAMEARLVRIEARLRQQYQALDDQMAQLNGLSSYVSAQMSALLSKG